VIQKIIVQRVLELPATVFQWEFSPEANLARERARWANLSILSRKTAKTTEVRGPTYSIAATLN
jgi:hypothetical protein